MQIVGIWSKIPGKFFKKSRFWASRHLAAKSLKLKKLCPYHAIPDPENPIFWVFDRIFRKIEFWIGEGRYGARGGNRSDTPIIIPLAAMLRKFGITGCISQRAIQQRNLYFFCQKKQNSVTLWFRTLINTNGTRWFDIRDQSEGGLGDQRHTFLKAKLAY